MIHSDGLGLEGHEAEALRPEKEMQEPRSSVNCLSQKRQNGLGEGPGAQTARGGRKTRWASNLPR